MTQYQNAAARRVTVPYGGRTYVGVVQADGTVRDLRVRYCMRHAVSGSQIVERGVAYGGKVRRAVVPLMKRTFEEGCA